MIPSLPYAQFLDNLAHEAQAKGAPVERTDQAGAPVVDEADLHQRVADQLMVNELQQEILRLDHALRLQIQHNGYLQARFQNSEVERGKVVAALMELREHCQEAFDICQCEDCHKAFPAAEVVTGELLVLCEECRGIRIERTV